MAAGLPELMRGKSVAGNEEGTCFFPPLPHSLKKRQGGGWPFLGGAVIMCVCGGEGGVGRCVCGEFVCLALSAALVGCVADSYMDAPSLLGLRKECHSFFPELQTVSSICGLNIFSRKNKVAASALKREACRVHVLQ